VAGRSFRRGKHLRDFVLETNSTGQVLTEKHPGVGSCAEAKDVVRWVPLQHGARQPPQVAVGSGMIGIEILEQVPLRCGVADQLLPWWMAQVGYSSHAVFLWKGRHGSWQTSLPPVAAIEARSCGSCCSHYLEVARESLEYTRTGWRNLIFLYQGKVSAHCEPSSSMFKGF
jgi:hypothetical protein